MTISRAVILHLMRDNGMDAAAVDLFTPMILRHIGALTATLGGGGGVWGHLGGNDRADGARGGDQPTPRGVFGVT